MDDVQLDPQVQAVLDAIGDMPTIDLDALPLEAAMRIARPALPLPPLPAQCEDRYVTAADGARLCLRLYYPATPAGFRPVVLYLHGGGFVGGSVAMDDTRCVRLAAMADCVVASLDYRLAPEYPFPTAIRDACDAWNWLAQRSEELGLDMQQGTIYGSSAGGHLAAGLVLSLLRQQAPLPRLLLLANPALDPCMACASYTEFSGGPFMTAARMGWYWRQYRGAGDLRETGLWTPLQENLAEFPPTHVMTAEYDVLRDEGELLVEKLRCAGVPATATRYPGMIHGFMTVLPDHAASRAAMAESAALVRAGLAGGGRAGAGGG
ncbi:alpha/beta hydrolase [Haliea sp. E17]|uniref:alpha/beta hydrolase n=1 Tax=Haliea sp. E17 TaxID=3401576 RepID=UPI003AAABC54